MYKKEEILNLLENNDKAVLRAVIRIYENQTLEEKKNKNTIDENGIGFSSVDAYFLSCMALKIKKGIRQSKIKFGICLLILFIILLFFWYYVSAFCSVYPNSQLAWVESSLITLAFNNLLSFLFLFLSSVLRFLSNKFKSLVLFKLSGILSDFS